MKASWASGLPFQRSGGVVRMPLIEFQPPRSGASMRFLPSKGKLALIGAAGLMAVMYAQRQKRAELSAAVDGSDESLASLVEQPGPNGQPVPAQAGHWADRPEPTAEDPYPEDRPTTLPTGAAPGG
jgi:hypothetical protein